MRRNEQEIKKQINGRKKCEAEQSKGKESRSESESAES